MGPPEQVHFSWILFCNYVNFILDGFNFCAVRGTLVAPICFVETGFLAGVFIFVPFGFTEYFSSFVGDFAGIVVQYYALTCRSLLVQFCLNISVSRYDWIVVFNVSCAKLYLFP